MHSIKKYKEEKDDFFNHNTKDEIGDISWSNYLKNNISFIQNLNAKNVTNVDIILTLIL